MTRSKCSRSRARTPKVSIRVRGSEDGTGVPNVSRETSVTTRRFAHATRETDAIDEAPSPPLRERRRVTWVGTFELSIESPNAAPGITLSDTPPRCRCAPLLVFPSTLARRADVEPMTPLASLHAACRSCARATRPLGAPTTSTHISSTRRRRPQRDLDERTGAPARRDTGLTRGPWHVQMREHVTCRTAA